MSSPSVHMLGVISHDTEKHGHLATMKRGPSIGERIVRAREAAGIGQAEMARRLNVSTATVFRWEHDKVEVPVERLRQVAELTKVPVSELIPEGEEDVTAEPVADDPVAHMQLAQLALAAAQGDDAAKRKLNEVVKKRARSLIAAEKRRSG